jgi:uncharacterized protein (DUF1778 family)
MAKFKRVPVSLSDDDMDKIKAAMAAIGIRAMSDFLRVAALEKAERTWGK